MSEELYICIAPNGKFVKQLWNEHLWYTPNIGLASKQSKEEWEQKLNEFPAKASKAIENNKNNILDIKERRGRWTQTRWDEKDLLKMISINEKEINKFQNNIDTITQYKIEPLANHRKITFEKRGHQLKIAKRIIKKDTINCSVCKVRIPFDFTYDLMKKTHWGTFAQTTICPFCLYNLVNPVINIIHEFEKENPELMEQYKTQIFLQNLQEKK
jgi:hypothetical protein